MTGKVEDKKVEEKDAPEQIYANGVYVDAPESFDSANVSNTYENAHEVLNSENEVPAEILYARKEALKVAEESVKDLPDEKEAEKAEEKKPAAATKK